MPYPIPSTIKRELLHIAGVDTVDRAIHDIRNTLHVGVYRILDALSDFEYMDARARGTLHPFLLDYVTRHYDPDPNLGPAINFIDTSNYTRALLMEQLRKAENGALFHLEAYAFKVVVWATRVQHQGRWFPVGDGHQVELLTGPPFQRITLGVKRFGFSWRVNPPFLVHDDATWNRELEKLRHRIADTFAHQDIVQYVVGVEPYKIPVV